MNTYSGVTFLIPAVMSFSAFFAWMVVVGRMTNLHFPLYKRVLTFFWAVSLLGMGVVDVSITHSFGPLVMSGREVSSDWKAVAVITLKTVVRLGILVLAIVRYKEIAKTHPVSMYHSPFEESPNIFVGVVNVGNAIDALTTGVHDNAVRLADIALSETPTLGDVR